MTLPPALESRFQELLTCMVFYTRLPAGRWVTGETDFAAAQWAAPVTGIVIGFCGGLVYAAAWMAGAPATVSAALCLAAIILLTGALHEDGAADMADGFGGGSTIEQKLEIMRDSRLGAYGALTLVISVLVRWSALSALADPLDVTVALVAAHAASRSVIAAFLMRVPPARSDGLGAGVGRIDGPVATTALLIGAVMLTLTGLMTAIAGAAMLAMWFFSLRALCIRQIGGQTGDVTGALQQGGEVIILVAVVSIGG